MWESFYLLAVKILKEKNGENECTDGNSIQKSL